MERRCKTQTEDDLKVLRVSSSNIIMLLIVILRCNYCKQMRPRTGWLVAGVSLHLSGKRITVAHVSSYFSTGRKVQTAQRASCRCDGPALLSSMLRGETGDRSSAVISTSSGQGHEFIWVTVYSLLRQRVGLFKAVEQVLDNLEEFVTES